MKFRFRVYLFIWVHLASDYLLCCAQAVTSAEEVQFKNGPAKLILEAARDGNVQQVDEQIKNGIDVNIKDEFERTALYIAAEYGRKEVALFLIRIGADVNSRQTAEWTPLHAASKNGHDELAELLIRNGANVNGEDIYKYTPIHFAAQRSKSDNEQVAEILLRNAANVNAKTVAGYSPLHEASEHGQTKVASLLVRHGAIVNDENNELCIPLHLAAQYGHGKIVDLLLPFVENINAKNVNQSTPLHLAVGNGKSDSFYGDSGGPLQIFPDPSSDMAILVGVVSFGVSCGTPLPAIYTRVAFYIDWIESIVWPKK